MTGSGVRWSFGLVPVQPWIAAARRSRDLLAGSAMLSWLVARLIERIRSAHGRVELPRLDDRLLDGYRGSLRDVLDQRRYGIPNRASGFLPTGEPDAAELFRRLEHALEAGWKSLVAEVAAATRRAQPELWTLIADEVQGAACPFQLIWCLGDAARLDLEGVDRLFAAVKRSRPVPPHDGAPVPKCGQCGRREAVGGRDPETWNRFDQRLQALPSVAAGERLSLGERLCAPCLVKRLAGYLVKGSFPSTSDVAARSWTAALRRAEPVKAALDALVRQIRGTPGYERPTADVAPLFYRRSLERERRAAARAEPSRDELVAALDRVAARQRELCTALAQWNRGQADPALDDEPSHYLAVLAFDGDRLAARVRDDPALASKIADFQHALAARLDGDEGALRHAQAFYLGGDEGLLLVPVDPALDAACEVEELWRDQLHDLAAPPTLSMGVAVFDRERSLGAALEAARGALDEAKDAGRDRLAMVVLTASGSRFSAVAPWGEGWRRPRAALGLLRDGVLSRGWPHDVERFLGSLPEAAWSRGGLDAIRAELRRLTYRRLPAGSRPEARARWWREQLHGESWWTDVPDAGLRRTAAGQLHLVAFLARESGPGAIGGGEVT